MKKLIPILVLLAGSSYSQEAAPGRQSFGDSPSRTTTASIPTPEPDVSLPAESGYSSSLDTKIDTGSEPVATPQSPDTRLRRFNWRAASNQSFMFLATEHGFRMSQSKTRVELGGRFWEDYRNAVSGLGGWGDTDSIFTNYVAHPMQGAVTGYIQIQNDPGGIFREFGKDPGYWKSRSRAMLWSALYSTQFELGPVGEAAFGNVGKKRGTMGMVDLVMTPLGGFGLIVVEDALDKKVVERLEAGTDSIIRRRFYRMAFNPQRSFANLLRFKVPWHRDTRILRWDLGTSLRPISQPTSDASSLHTAR